MVSTINGDSNVPFYKELGNAGLKATDVPVVASRSARKNCAASDQAAGRPPGRLELLPVDQEPENDKFIKMYKDWAKKQNLPKADTVVTNDPMEATYVGIHMWEAGGREGQDHRRGQGHRRDGRPEVQGAVGLRDPRWTRRTTTCTSPVFIGEIKADGQFNVVWKTKGPVKAAPWSRSSRQRRKKDEAEASNRRQGAVPAGTSRVL